MKAALLLLVAALCHAQDLANASLEELMDIQVTSVSKKEQKLSHTAAAVFVITQDDIRRSGATNLPDALMMAPGIQVARIDTTRWAITSRGFNGKYSNKMLVLVDGRSVYDPIFPGVHWDAQNVPLDDIERIEVIRGPGASVCGANAMNRVINVITRSASETRADLLVAVWQRTSISSTRPDMAPRPALPTTGSIPALLRETRCWKKGGSVPAPRANCPCDEGRP